MALKFIVSYDDTDNDRDALALGRLLAYSGAELALAYVRHSQGGALEEKEAEELLARGAASVGAPDMPRHVVVNPGTSVGLAELAERENADVIVFGSEYRTAPGTVKPGIPAHKLLLGGPAAIAVAPAGLHSNPSISVNTIGILDEGDPSAREVAEQPRLRAWRKRRRAWQRPGRPARRRLAPRVAAGEGHHQRRERLRGGDRDVPGAGAPRGVGVRLRAGPDPGRLTTRMTAAISGSRPSTSSGPRPVGRPALVPGDHLRHDGLRRFRLDHECVGQAPRRRLGQDAAGYVLRRTLGIRPSLAEGEVLGLHLRTLEDYQAALARLPLPVAHLDTPVLQPRLKSLRGQVLPG